MRPPKPLLFMVAVCFAVIQTADATDSIETVTLPPAEGTIVGAVFSPDSSQLILLRHVADTGSSGQRHVIQSVNLASRREGMRADVPTEDAADLASSIHFIKFSPDGCYLVIGKRASDVVFILDAATLQPVYKIALHPETDSRVDLGAREHHHFKGIIDLAVAAKADVFAVLTHDELGGNEVFVGSYSLRRIVKKWELGPGRAATQIGQISLSIASDGSRIAASALPSGNTIPKNFYNIRIYDSSSGRMVKAIRTSAVVGKVETISNEDILVSRIDTPGIFSKKACIEKWNLNSGTLVGQLCDNDRNVTSALAVSLASDRVVGFSSRMRKSIEGQIYAVSGRVDVWDVNSGRLIAASSDLPRLISDLQVSPDGKWVMGDQSLFKLSPIPLGTSVP
jgi:WD40 repeat protein